MSEEDRRIVRLEEDAAEKYLCERIRFEGPLQHIPDGRKDLLLQFTWENLVKLLRNHAIGRITSYAEGSWRAASE